MSAARTGVVKVDLTVAIKARLGRRVGLCLLKGPHMPLQRKPIHSTVFCCVSSMAPLPIIPRKSINAQVVLADGPTVFEVGTGGSRHQGEELARVAIDTCEVLLRRQAHIDLPHLRWVPWFTNADAPRANKQVSASKDVETSVRCSQKPSDHFEFCAYEQRAACFTRVLHVPFPKPSGSVSSKLLRGSQSCAMLQSCRSAFRTCQSYRNPTFVTANPTLTTDWTTLAQIDAPGQWTPAALEESPPLTIGRARLVRTL